MHLSSVLGRYHWFPVSYPGLLLFVCGCDSSKAEKLPLVFLTSEHQTSVTTPRFLGGTKYHLPIPVIRAYTVPILHIPLPSSTTHIVCQMLSWEDDTVDLSWEQLRGGRANLATHSAMRRWTLSLDTLNTTFMCSKTKQTAALTMNQRLVLK